MTIGCLVLESLKFAYFLCKMEDEDKWTAYMTLHSPDYLIICYNLKQWRVAYHYAKPGAGATSLLDMYQWKL